MQTYKTSIIREETKASLALEIGQTTFTIPLTEDKPNDVKGVFNKLLTELKKRKIKFVMEDTKEDLYYHICKEYLTQLNSELEGAHKELEDYGLLDSSTGVDVEEIKLNKN